MYFDFTEIGPQNAYKLLVSSVVPRPIAWVVSQNSQGRLNAAPFSFFNVMSGDPPIVALGIGTRPQGGAKYSSRNIVETGQFVINLVDEALAEKMNITAIEFDAEVNELEVAQIQTSPSTRVAPPRIRDSPVAFECELFEAIPISPQRSVILGRVLACHVRDSLILDPVRCYLATPEMNLVGRMHGAGWYVRTHELFQIERYTVKQWQER